MCFSLHWITGNRCQHSGNNYYSRRECSSFRGLSAGVGYESCVLSFMLSLEMSFFLYLLLKHILILQKGVTTLYFLSIKTKYFHSRFQTDCHLPITKFTIYSQNMVQKGGPFLLMLVVWLMYSIVQVYFKIKDGIFWMFGAWKKSLQFDGNELSLRRLHIYCERGTCVTSS